MSSFQELYYAVLGGVFFSIPFVMAVLLGLGLPILLLQLWRSPAVGLGLVALVFWADIHGKVPLWELGITVFLPDLMAGLLAIVGLARLLPGKFNKVERLWILFSVVFFGSLVAGLLTFKSAAGVEVRYHFYYWAVVTYFMRAPIGVAEFKRLGSVYAALLVGIILVGVYRWAGMAMGFGDVQAWNEAGSTLRVMTVDPAGVLLMGVIFSVYAPRFFKPGSLLGYLGLPAFVCAVMLQHRTVWGAGLITALFLSAVARQGGKASRGRVALLVAGGVLVVGAIALGGGKASESLERSVGEVSEQNSTWAWRTQSWAELAKLWASGGPKAWAVGFSYGAGFDRHIEGAQGRVEQNPHSNYVYLLLRVGLVGLGAMLLSMLLALKELVRRRGDAVAALLAGGLVFQFAYFIPYPGTYGLAVFVGLAFAYVRGTQRWSDQVAVDAKPGAGRVGPRRWSLAR